MRAFWKDMLMAVWLGMIIPGIWLNGMVAKERNTQKAETQSTVETAIQDDNSMIPIKHSDGINRKMDPESYLTGVLLAEIPASFHEEALKAQAAVARTYTWKAFTTGGKHDDNSVCTDASCCQAYISPEEYLSGGGTQAYVNKIRSAVASTYGMVLAYEGELIEATYFSSSGGKTESAAAVWGADYPYLQPVSSPEETYEDSLIFSVEEFGKSLGINLTEMDSQWFGPVSYTDGGGVATMVIGGQSYTGIQLRTLLDLRSTDFQIKTEDGNIIVITRGYGHRVGLSQYGANTMAEQGSTWQRILQHYYPGTTLASVY